MVALVAGVVGLSACGDTDLEDLAGRQGRPIVLSGRVEAAAVSRVDEQGFQDGDVMGVYITDYEGDKASPLAETGNRATNMPFTYDEAANRWEGAHEVYWKDGTTAVDVYGYYPYAYPDGVRDYAFEVQRDQSGTTGEGGMGGYEASDFLWAKAEKQTPGEGVITLAFRHRMCLARVTLAEGEGFAEGEWEGLEKQVLVTNTRREASIDLATGEVSARGEAAETGIVPAEREGTYRAITVPQVIKAGTELFRVTVDGTVYAFRKGEDFTYTSGRMHKFTITVNKKETTGKYEFVAAGEAITEWESDPVAYDASGREYVIIESEAGRLQQCILSAGKDPGEIKNLKVTGEINGADFYFMRDEMDKLEALNLKEVRIRRGGDKETDEMGLPLEEDKIPCNALMSKASLRHVELPSHLKAIGQNAFASCTALTGSLAIPEGVTEVGLYAFHQCSSLNGNLSLPSTLTTIGEAAFQETRFVSELILPKALKSIGAWAFYNNHYLTGNLVLPEGLSELGACAFHSCRNLRGNLRIPQGVKKIPEMAFYLCGFDGQLTLHNGIEEIGAHAFEGNAFKGELILPENLTTVKTSAFYGCRFSGTLKLPKSLTYIGDYAFGENPSLSGRLEIPEGVLSIGAGTFSDNKITEVIIPGNVESILASSENGDGAFQGCRSLTRIVCKGSIPPRVMEGSFADVPRNNVMVEVPEAAVDQYRIADGWSRFQRIVAYRELECLPAEVMTLNGGGERTLTLRAEGEWEVVDKPSWCSLSRMSGGEKAEVTLTVEGTPGKHTVRGNIVFRLKGTDYTATCRVVRYGYKHDEDEMIRLQTHEKGQGVKVVLVGDGFSAEEIAAGDYEDIMRSQMEAFFSAEPYRTYRPYFDVYMPIALSPEKGIGSEHSTIDTRFNTCYVPGMGLTCQTEDLLEYVARFPEIGQEALTQTLVILVPNTAEYEGRTMTWEDGTTIAICPRSLASDPDEAERTMRHEAGGHGFGKLADETVLHGDFIDDCNCSCCLHADEIRQGQARGWYQNISLTGKLHEVPWAHLLQDSRYSSRVDLYEGGAGHARGVYRSEPNSCMNNGGSYFNAISREAIVKRIMTYAGETYDYASFVANDRTE